MTTLLLYFHHVTQKICQFRWCPRYRWYG